MSILAAHRTRPAPRRHWGLPTALLVGLGALSTLSTLSGLAGCVKLPPSNNLPFGVPETCINDKLDGNESDVDCGGSCGRCSPGQKCNSSLDCGADSCIGGRCTPSGSTCFDRVKDGPETDADCGGGCAKCAAGKACASATDCESGSCTGGVCGAGTGPFNFAPARFARTDKGATALVVVDLDGDGKLDVATANETTGTVGVLAGAGDGTLKDATSYPAGKSTTWIGAADIDEDGRVDLVALPREGNGFLVLRNLGALDFGGTPRAITSATTNRPVAAQLVDLDLDGHVDVVLASGSGQLTVFHGSGGGRFDGGALLGPPGIGPSRLAVADVDGDKRPDVAVVADMIVKVLHGPGFLSNDLALSLTPWNVTLAPLRPKTAPGVVDVIASGLDGEIAVLLGMGNGDFGSAVTYRTGSAPFSVAAADFDGDGATDLATCNQGSSDLSLLAGHGDGTFEPPINRWLGGSPQEMVVADMNRDGLPDLVMCDYWQHDVGVLLNLKK